MLDFDSLTSLDEVKDFLKIQSDDTDAQRDRTIVRAIVAATDAIEAYLGRKFKLKNDYVEYIDGTGSPSIFLSRYPVRSITSLYDDTAGEFGSSTLIDASNYVIDEEEGIVRIYREQGGFSSGVHNVKVTYDGGYGFRVIASENDKIDFDEGASELTATLTAGTYSVRGLATHIKAQMESAGALTYTIKYSTKTGKYTISGSSTFSLLPYSGSNWDRTAYPTLGFDADEDYDDVTSQSAEYSVFGVPDEVVLAATLASANAYHMSRHGDNRLGRYSRSMSGAGTVGTERFQSLLLTDEVIQLITPYERMITA